MRRRMREGWVKGEERERSVEKKEGMEEERIESRKKWKTRRKNGY